MYVYCDNAATTPLSKQAYDAMLPWLETGYGNASSIYRLAREAKVALEGARKTVAGCLGVAPEEVYFTSGGTESDNWALKSGAELGGDERRHIVISAVEHHAVVNTAEYLSKKKGYTHTEAAADKDGLVSAEALQKALRPNTALVSVIAANNEIGTIQPIEELAGLTKEYDKKILFHTDAVQAAGHIPLPLNGDVDMLSMSAHKFGGPKGVGVLYIKNGVKLPPLLHGGGHERGRRSSTENVAGILGLAAALEYMTSNRKAFAAKVTKLREMLIGGILSTVPYCKLTGHREKRLPGTASFIFAALEGESLVLRLDELGVAGSSGSACASGSLDPSHVLMAIGLPHETAHGSLRLTVSHTNTEEEMEFVIRAVAAAAERCRAISPLWDINRPAASFLPYFE